MSNIDDYFSNIIDFVNGSIYWKDKDGVYLGCNEYAIKVIGANCKSDLIGKTDYDLFDKNIADKFRFNDLKIMNENIELSIEEEGILPNGEKVIRLSNKKPLYDKNNIIIGIIGNTIDITAVKQAAQLKLENQAYQIENQQQKRFKKLVERVIHDIGSPIGTITLMMPELDVIPEQKRLTLKNSVTRIRDVLGGLWDEFLPEKHHNNGNMNLTSVPVCEKILDVINEKKYEFIQYSIDFILQISDAAYFAFIKVETKEFKRMLSNLINNAVDALSNTEFKKIVLHLDIVDDKVRIVVEDNGRGMPDAVKDKILNNIRVTSGKINGHGVGFEYIREILTNNNGILSIESKQNWY